MCAYHNPAYPPNYPETSYYANFQPSSQEYVPAAPRTNGNTGMSFIQNQFIPDLAVRYGSAMFDEGANFVHKNKWGVNYDPAGPVPPGDDINAPDLYIPLMATITYILLSGVIFGFQGRFSPEYLGILSSEAFGWLLLEVLLSLFAIYILNIQNNISYLDIVAYCGYKFVSMIVVLISYIGLDRPGYYFSLLYTSLALAFFLIRSLKLKILPHVEAYPSECNKRRLYLLLLIAFTQPFLMWWLTRRVIL
ncbi:protein transport protein YIF1 [Schistosoma bovis]|uniref:Protein YIF1 n=1 Tax=Schistosoma bovis TaxID=6184 RepID=A0A430QGD8_SCHBO|nr:protein transport protein YIF1 [Schistosoma bovis]